jgi:hypothetical protein
MDPSSFKRVTDICRNMCCVKVGFSLALKPGQWHWVPAVCHSYHCIFRTIIKSDVDSSARFGGLCQASCGIR